MTTDATAQPRRSRMLDWRTLWPVALAGALSLLVVIQWLGGLQSRQPAIGDGETVTSYGFDLAHCRVPRDRIAATGFPRDGVPALTDPNVYTIAAAEAFERQMRRAHQGKFLIKPERVIGVSINDDTRAYPLRILAWHQIINDTVGGLPIAITYDPLCDSAAVFDRRVNDEPLTFGVSGLVYNSNLLMYDRHDHRADESLWSQLQCRAIAGPAAERGDRLSLAPFALLPWKEWKAAQPNTTILAPLRAWWKVYKRSYGAYYSRPRLHFPVAPLPPRDDRPWKTPMIAVRVANEWRAFSITKLVENVSGGLGTINVAGTTVPLHCRANPPTAWLAEEAPNDARAIYTFWFAWHAMESGLWH